MYPLELVHNRYPQVDAVRASCKDQENGGQVMDLKIDRLTLTLDNIPGQEHRAGPIAARAAALFAERLERLAAKETFSAPDRVSYADAPGLNMNLQNMATEQAASVIANAWLDATLLQLRR
jgi:hypothetical protein